MTRPPRLRSQKKTDAHPLGSSPHVAPGRPGSVVAVKPHYDNFIGGKWVAAVNGQYMVNPDPVDGQPFCDVAKSSPADVELALDAAHAARVGAGQPGRI
jgi:aldehyde dehydrogenase